MFKFKGLPAYLEPRSREYDLTKIKFTLDSKNLIKAKVRGTHPYIIVFEKDLDCIYTTCTCPFFLQEQECKHIVAVANHLEHTFFGQQLDPMQTYHFLSDEEEFDDDFEDDFDDDYGDDFEDELNDEYSRGRGRGRFIYEKQKSSTEIIKNLTHIKKNKAMSSDWFFQQLAPVQEVIAEVWYEILELGLYLDQVRIRLHVRSLLKNGSFGKLKNKSINLGQLELITKKEDRDLVHALIPYGHFITSKGIDEAHVPFERRDLLIGIFKSGRAFSNKFYGGEESPWVWNEETVDVKLKIDTKNRMLNVSSELLGQSIQGMKILSDLSVASHESNLYPIRSSIDFLLLKELVPLFGKKLTKSNWEKLKKFILNHFDHHAIGGDYFELPLKVHLPKFKFFLKIEGPFIRGLLQIESMQDEKAIWIYDEQGHKVLNEIISRLDITLDAKNCFTIQRELLTAFVSHCRDNDIDVFFQSGKVQASKSFHMNVSSGIDWFEADIMTDNQELTISHLIQAAKEKSQFVKLTDGSVHIIPEEILEKISRLLKFGEVKGGKILLHKTRALLLDEMADHVSKTDQGYITFLKGIRNFATIQEENPHADFRGKLRPYQNLGLGWISFLERLGIGGCLADDMGLGKTVQVIGHLHKRISSGAKKATSLIVCPKSLIFNWKNEFEKFAPSVNVFIFSGGDWNPEFLQSDVVLMSYNLMQRNAELMHEHVFDYIVLDEAQNIKNSSSLTFKAASALKSHHRLALTGTPIENHVGELMSIFNFLMPGSFKRNQMSGGASELKELKFIKPFMLRRKKEEVLKDLPPKTVQVIYCDQTPEEEKHYVNLKRHIQRELNSKVSKDEKGGKNTIIVLEALTRLRQASCHLGLLESKLLEKEFGKFIVLKEMLEEILAENHKVIIFSQFTELLKLARNFLSLDETNSCYLDGKTKDREAVVQQFKSSVKHKCFFVSLKAGGVGLNLTEASYCFLLDPWWNPAVEAQAIDRIHRIGQRQHVNAYRLITKGTIEEKVLQLQEIKRSLTSEILEGNEDFIRKLGRDDIEFLLT